MLLPLLMQVDMFTAAPPVSWTLIGTPFTHTSTNWSERTFYFEAYYRATTGTAYTRLYDSTDASGVASSQLSTASATAALERTAAISLTDAHEYQAQVGVVGADAGAIKGARVIAAWN